MKRKTRPSAMLRVRSITAGELLAAMGGSSGLVVDGSGMAIAGIGAMSEDDANALIQGLADDVSEVLGIDVKVTTGL